MPQSFAKMLVIFFLGAYPLSSKAEFYPSIFGSINQTRSESGDTNKVTRDGSGYEVGASCYFDGLSIEGFLKSIAFKETEAKDTGESNELKFDDRLIGAGLRMSLGLLSSKLGYALHNYDSEKFHNHALSEALSNKGNDQGLYFGLGINIPANDWSLYVDYTRFRLYKYEYKIDDISIGLRYRLGFLSSK